MSSYLVLFDIDGTLIDTAGAGRRAMETAFHEVYRIDGVSAKAAGVRYAGMTDPTILEAVAEAVGVGTGDFEVTGPALERSFLRALRHEMQQPNPASRVLPGVRPLLDTLADRDGVHLGLLTGNLEEGARVKLEAFGLNAYFASGGFSSDHRDRREIARVARDRLADLTGIDFAEEHVTVIGDTEHDVDCARANGFRAIAVDSGWVPREQLEQAGPDHLLDDLSDLPATLAAIGLNG